MPICPLGPMPGGHPVTGAGPPVQALKPSQGAPCASTSSKARQWDGPPTPGPDGRAYRRKRPNRQEASAAQQNPGAPRSGGVTDQATKTATKAAAVSARAQQKLAGSAEVLKDSAVSQE